MAVLVRGRVSCHSPVMVHGSVWRSSSAVVTPPPWKYTRLASTLGVTRLDGLPRLWALCGLPRRWATTTPPPSLSSAQDGSMRYQDGTRVPFWSSSLEAIDNVFGVRWTCAVGLTYTMPVLEKHVLGIHMPRTVIEVCSSTKSGIVVARLWLGFIVARPLLRAVLARL